MYYTKASKAEAKSLNVSRRSTKVPAKAEVDISASQEKEEGDDFLALPDEIDQPLTESGDLLTEEKSLS